MSSIAVAVPSAPIQADTGRRIVFRTRGQRHGPIVRLMSPSDLGEVLKPFVFLDLFEASVDVIGEGIGLHPHSGIATVTVLTEGELAFDDPQAGRGTLGYGGVEWMRAGNGVWHGKELSRGRSPFVQGFQLWTALPPELENGAFESQYLEASSMPRLGPAYVILGRHENVVSPVRSPEGLNYLLVTLAPGESWTYVPPSGHRVAWLAMAKGHADGPGRLSKGELVLFEEAETPIALRADEHIGAVFVIGSAVPHPHELHLGYYSVHTSREALKKGEQRIRELGLQLQAAGDRRTASGTIPVFR